MSHERIAEASADLVAKVKDTQAAKVTRDAAAAALVEAEDILRAAHAAEVEAHEAVRSALVTRRKERRAL